MKILFWLFIGLDRQETSEHLLVSVIEQLCKSGHEVHILQKDTGGNLPSIPNALSCYPVTTTTIPFEKASKGNFIARYYKELNYISKCKKHLKQEYDAVFIQSNTVAGFAVKAVSKKLPNAKITFNVQDIFPYNLMYCGRIKQNGLLFKLLAKEQRYAYTHADHVITISEDMKDTLINDGVSEEKISVIYNWSYQDEPYKNIDTSSVSNMFSNEYFNVVYAGNIGIMQNVDLIVEAAYRLRDDKTIWFHIIGNGVYKKQLEDKVLEYGIRNISFWPMHKPEVAPYIYSAADVNIIPLRKNIYKTAFPSKSATCLACNKPIIFAIGKNCKIGKRVQIESGCPICDSDNIDEFITYIKLIKNHSVCVNTINLFVKSFSKDINSREYCRIITL